MDPVSWAFTTETPDTTAPTVTGRTPAAGATGVPVGTTVTATFSEAVQQATIALELRAPGGAVVPSGTACNATTRTITLTPSAALAATTTYTVDLSGTKDVSGNVMAPVTWTFTTEAPDTTKPTVTSTSPASGATSGQPAAPSPGCSARPSSSPRSPSSCAPRRTCWSRRHGLQRHHPHRHADAERRAAVGTTYTARISGARDTAGNTMDPVSWTFTTTASSYGCPCTIWPNTATPERTDPDTASVELGVKFRPAPTASSPASATTSPSVSTGTHVGTLWTGTGTKLGTVTFTNETTSGWQQATFPAPVAVTAGTTYVASYFTPSRYAASSAYFTTATTRGPLTALANGTDGGNGLYRYTGTAAVFPNSTYNSENYWVDVVFAETAVDYVAPVVTTRNPAPGSTGMPVSTRPSATFSEAVTPGSISMVLRHSGTQQVVSSSTAYDAGTYTATLTPTAQLAYSTGYTVTLSGAQDAAATRWPR